MHRFLFGVLYPIIPEAIQILAVLATASTPRVGCSVNIEHFAGSTDCDDDGFVRFGIGELKCRV